LFLTKDTADDNGRGALIFKEEASVAFAGFSGFAERKGSSSRGGKEEHE
jgi:hypothetical protein